MTELPPKQLKAIKQLSSYLLFKINVGDRLTTVSCLATSFSLSVGLVQASLMYLESQSAIRIIRKGHLGSYLESIDHELLSTFLGFNHLVCVMPMPYTKRYEGLATGIKSNLSKTISFHYAFMRGADVRLKMLCKGSYDYCIVSKYAAQVAMQENENLTIALSFPENSYISEHVLLKKNAEITKLGIDFGSIDHTVLSQNLANNYNDIELIAINYNEVEQLIEEDHIDAVIVNRDDLRVLNLGEITSLPESEFKNSCTQAVLVCRKDNDVYYYFAQKFMDVEKISLIQQSVINKKINPHY